MSPTFMRRIMNVAIDDLQGGSRSPLRAFRLTEELGKAPFWQTTSCKRRGAGVATTSTKGEDLPIKTMLS